LEEAIEKTNSFSGYAWGVWGSNDMFDNSTKGYLDFTAPERSTAHFFTTRQNCNSIQLDTTLENLYDSVKVKYQDASGESKYVTVEQSITPISYNGGNNQFQLDAGVATESSAQSIGQLFLDIIGNSPPAKGTIVLSGTIQHHEKGDIPAHYLRADGSNIKITDILGGYNKSLIESNHVDYQTIFPIKRVVVSVKEGEPEVTIEVDQTNDSLTALQARLEVNQIARNLG